MSDTTQWSIPEILDVITDAVPDREMIVWGDTRRTYADVRDRTRRFAANLMAHGLRVEHERADLEPWQCGQPRVAIIMSNAPEYLEAMIGSYRARAVPYNVNHQYTPGEVADLVGTIGSDAIVYHRRFGPLLGELDDLADKVLIHVDDHSDVAPLAGSTAFEDALGSVDDSTLDELPRCQPDDLYMVCTGGTTGRPKGVLWRQADVFIAGMNGTATATADTLRTEAETFIGTYFASPPLMHGAAQWTAYSGILHGGTVVLHDDSRRFDAEAICTIAEREQVNVMSIVGDAFARPIIAELRRESYDLSPLFIIGTGGAATHPDNKAALLELLPHVVVVDGYGSSETGAAGYGSSTKDGQTRSFSPTPGSIIVDDTMTRVIAPGSDEVGWAARATHVPLGYLGDEAKTRATFRTIDGTRVSVSGDRAHYAADDQLVLLGRDSMVVNTGGEKVFVEEVEEVIRRHPDVADVLVVGRPDERFGEVVVALVQPRDGTTGPDPVELRSFTAERIARYKAPKAILMCDRLSRFPTGKPNYQWARDRALTAPSVTS